MVTGQTERVHVVAFGADQVNNPSQTVDPSAVLTAASFNTNVATAQIDPGNNRTVIVTAVAPGTCGILLNENPALPGGASPAGGLQLNVTVSAPPIDNRRIDFVNADPPA
jgi:hypothetical protein